MRNLLRVCPHLFACLLLVALLSACGSKNNNNPAMISSWNPTVFYSHSVALGVSNGLLYVWGANSSGQLGNADITGKMMLFPQPLPYLMGVRGASAGGTHTLAFTETGAVWAWGNNYFGELGTGNSTLSIIPLPVVWTVLHDTITAVAAGGFHSLALDASGMVYAWGNGGNGQLGNNSMGLSVYPEPVQQSSSGGNLLANVIRIAAGGSHSLAIVGTAPTDHSGTAYAWGYGGPGQLGQADIGDRAYAVPVVKNDGSGNLTNVTDIAAGGSHSLFVSGGQVYACGNNAQGQIGDGTLNNAASGAIKITLPAAAIGTVLQVAAGLNHSLALVDDGSGNKGTVWAWGYNYFGQLGNGAPLGSLLCDSAIPVQVMTGPGQPLQNIKKILAIGNFSFAVDAYQRIWAWGDNTFGQLGTGDIANRNYATQITLLGNWTDLYHPMP